MKMKYLPARIQFIIDEMFRMAAEKAKMEKIHGKWWGRTPQIGESVRVITIDVTATGSTRTIYRSFYQSELVNKNGDMVDGREGCWSCGNFCANVPRYSHVTLRGLNRSDIVRREFEGFVARIAQHEVDHLDGIRCIDRVPLGEEWRLHDVEPSEFEVYRTGWPHWAKTFAREELDQI